MNQPDTPRFASLDDCIDEQKRLSRELDASRIREQKLLRRLYFHEKSGLPNRALLSKDLARAMSRVTGRGQKGGFAVMFVQLDETFDMLKRAQKSVLSEWVLYRSALLIRGVVKTLGSVYQTKSNEFAVLFIRENSMEECADVINQICNAVSQMHRFPGQTISVGCTIGCAMYPDHGATPGEILRNADIALSFARSIGRGGLLFDPSMSSEITEKINIQEGILHALEEQARIELEAQFTLEFQPLVRVLELNGSGVRTRTVGSECLLRWNHPERGTISPDQFIPLAEENGLIIPIGNWVFYRAADSIRRWRALGFERLYVSINLSPIQFKDIRLVENIQRLLSRQQLPPEAFQFEITETAVMEDPEEALRKIEELHALGLRLSIDDFGTGYSSLGYLRNLRVDTLKIDRSFVEGIAHDQYDQSIVRAIVSMARSLGVEVLAEGIESREQIEFLNSLGCNKLQGFFFSQPLSQTSFETYLQNN